MSLDTIIRYIKHKDIDSEKWNRCIDMAINCRIYAFDWHLDRTAEIWDALVMGNYEYVMPLPFRKKLGIRYIYQPLYSQQLGIFPTPSEKILEAFVQAIKKQFRYCDIHLNAENIPSPELKSHISDRKNYLLSLHNDYQILAKAFSKNTKRNISRSKNNGLTLIEGIRLEDYLSFKAENLSPNTNKKILTSLKRLISVGINKGHGQIYGVYSAQNQLCAAVYFCRWKERVIYFNAVSNTEGKELRAMHFLLNSFIEKNTGKGLILDFEGSMIPGVARFYSGFGAQLETYFHLKFNHLSLPLRWLKR